MKLLLPGSTVESPNTRTAETERLAGFCFVRAPALGKKKAERTKRRRVREFPHALDFILSQTDEPRDFTCLSKMKM